MKREVSTSQRFGAFILDTLGAPRLSKLTLCGAPLVEGTQNYLAQFAVNFVTGVKGEYPERQRRILVMLCRRTQHAIEEYNAGRECLLFYVENLPKTNSHFIEALNATTHFEQCISSTCQAVALFNALLDLANKPRPDDAHLSKLRMIWARSKHFNDDLMKENITKTNITAPVWITNVGIACTDGSVTFIELHTTLTHLLTIVKKVCAG
jgi:hypothetical protein